MLRNLCARFLFIELMRMRMRYFNKRFLQQSHFTNRPNGNGISVFIIYFIMVQTGIGTFQPFRISQQQRFMAATWYFSFVYFSFAVKLCRYSFFLVSFCGCCSHFASLYFTFYSVVVCDLFVVPIVTF